MSTELFAWPAAIDFILSNFSTGLMVDRELDLIFIEEAERRLAEAEQILDGPFPRVGTPELMTLQRHAHSLKGVAGSVGHPVIEALARDAWSAIEGEMRGELQPADVESDVRREFRLMREELARANAARVSQP